MELDKACFEHDMADGKSKDLVKITQSNKVQREKVFEIASDPKYDGCQRGLASMVYKFFDKKSSGSGIINEPNYQLANELHKPIIRKFKKEKFIHLLETIFGLLIQLICNHLANIIKRISIYCEQLICLVNMGGLFL